MKKKKKHNITFITENSGGKKNTYIKSLKFGNI